MIPILLNSCARAATAAEARYRIDVPIEGRRGARVVALDDAAAAVLGKVARQPWNGARFFTLSAEVPLRSNGSVDVAMRDTDGRDTRLVAELADADVAVMVAGSSGNAAAAFAIGDACARRGIMTAGMVLGGRDEARNAVAALRPHARVLLVTADDDDVTELLIALRA